ncbi:ATP-binding protein [Candidatus Poribacteria bacterium]|nr:ATP-binding protein [Candidatus Poribacteria bacterium]
MTQLQLPLDTEASIQNRFSEAGIEIQSIERRDYPEEIIFIVHVTEDDLDSAAIVGNSLDLELAEQGFDGFVAVRKAAREVKGVMTRLEHGVRDPKATELANLLIARSRTSETQPSLSYIPDTAQNILTVITPRHHLIFGRRGTGKTALMVEAKRRIESKGHLSAWVNIQTHRRESADRVFVWICRNVCDQIQVFYSKRDRAPQILALTTKLRDDAEQLIAEREIPDGEIGHLVPRMQDVIRRFGDTNTTRFYIFLDDLHSLPKSEQPQLLDLVHGAVRDSDAWLKVAGIRHLTRWFQPRPPLGLQTGHDADHIDLDVTLETPSQAKTFLEQVFLSYAKHVGISSLSNILSRTALDRLVLASGAVPRDYLTLSASAISQAQTRENARLVGVQDVGKAAGDAAKVKISELEEDAASIEGTPNRIIKGLQQIRRFCIDEKNCTFFRIDFRDRENYLEEYGIIRELMDLRLIHLVRASLSDIQEAGRRYEVYMLDLSQFSSERLKLRLKVLDFRKGYMVFRETGTTTEPIIGNTSKQLSGILRRGPLFELRLLSDII